MSTEMLTAISKHWPVLVYLPAVIVAIVILMAITKVSDRRSDPRRRID